MNPHKIKHPKRRIYLFILVPVVFIVSLAASEKRPAHHTHNGFKNPFPGFEERSLFDLLKWSVWERISGQKPEQKDTYNLHARENDGRLLRQNKNGTTVTWIGHSTLLIQLNNLNILTDPIWSERSSPVSFAGPKRFVKPGVPFKNLPKIDVVIISHDHYDHLDKTTVGMIGNNALYIVPLGIDQILNGWGITNYQALDWGDSLVFNNTTFICTPAQHFSGRGLLDQNRTLWASWLIKGNKTIYFGGDSGYFPGYTEIGKHYGPIHFAALPVGAYLPLWFMKPIHMSPAEALQAFLDLQAQRFLPIHWGTYMLADEQLDQPPRDLEEAAEQLSIDQSKIWMLKQGETKTISP